MPELPEVETVRRIVDQTILGRRITSVTFRDFPGVLESSIPGIDPAATMLNRSIVATGRRGKYLMLHLDKGVSLVVHLRMTGRLLLVPHDAEPVRFEHLAIGLDDAMDLRFADQRKFGRITLADSGTIDALDRKLGPEPDSPRLTASSLQHSLQRRPGKIKHALLDQSLIAGLGNIYVDESLYRSRINPERISRTLTVEEASRLLRAIRHVLRLALENQGTTFSSFENPYGESGSNASFLRAYGRAGQPCLRCGSTLERTVVAGRGTTYCPVCQPIESSLDHS